MALRGLLDHGQRPLAVYTQPDRPAGRGRRLQASAVKQLALAERLPLRQPPSLRDPAAIEALRASGADYLVVVAYGQILPPPALEATRHGALNVHASLLPRWRGAAPVQRAILAGDRETGVSIMQLDAGLDTGPVLLERRCPIHDDDTGGRLHDRLAALGAQALCEALDGLAAGRLQPREQPDSGVTYAAKLDKAEGLIDWDRPAGEIERLVRAFDPWPGAYTLLDGERLRVHAARAQPVVAAGVPGQVLTASADGIDVHTGDGVLRLTRVQRAGGRALDAGEFLNARPVHPGSRLGTVTPAAQERQAGPA